MRIRFDNEQDRLDAYEPMRQFIDCGVLTLNMTNNRLYQVPVSAQSIRMELNSLCLHWRPMTYCLDVDFVHYKPVAIVPAPESNHLLRAQLASRDAALDAVLELAKRWNDEHAETKDLNGGAELTAVLLKHGVRPK